MVNVIGKNGGAQISAPALLARRDHCQDDCTCGQRLQKSSESNVFYMLLFIDYLIFTTAIKFIFKHLQQAAQAIQFRLSKPNPCSEIIPNSESLR